MPTSVKFLINTSLCQIDAFQSAFIIGSTPPHSSMIQSSVAINLLCGEILFSIKMVRFFKLRAVNHRSCLAPISCTKCSIGLFDLETGDLIPYELWTVLMQENNYPKIHHQGKRDSFFSWRTHHIKASEFMIEFGCLCYPSS